MKRVNSAEHEIRCIQISYISVIGFIFQYFICIAEATRYLDRDFFAILGRGPWAFQIGKISAVNHYFGKFSKQTRTAFLVSLKTKLAITHTIAIKLKENRMQF